MTEAELIKLLERLDTSCLCLRKWYYRQAVMYAVLLCCMIVYAVFMWFLNE